HADGRARARGRRRRPLDQRPRRVARRRASHEGERVAVRRPVAEPLTRVVRFDATDGLELSGLLFEPKRRTKRAIVWLHGTGGANVFESKRTNRLAVEFTAAGFAFFPFNNRGAHLARMFRGRKRGGMAWEKIRECVFDIDGAARELRRRGFRELWLV